MDINVYKIIIHKLTLDLLLEKKRKNKIKGRESLRAAVYNKRFSIVG